jgi:hypothetical protein
MPPYGDAPASASAMHGDGYIASTSIMGGGSNRDSETRSNNSISFSDLRTTWLEARRPLDQLTPEVARDQFSGLLNMLSLKTSASSTAQDEEQKVRRLLAGAKSITEQRRGLDSFAGINYSSDKLDGYVNRTLTKMYKASRSKPRLSDLSLEDRLRVTVTAAFEKAGQQVSEEQVDAAVDHIITTAADLRQQMPFYGIPDPSKAVVQPLDYGGNTSQPALLSAFEGPSKLTTGLFILELSESKFWQMDKALPLRRVDNLAGVEVEQIIFNNTMLDRVPLLGTATYVTHRTQMKRATQVRYGKAAETEMTFYRTEKGKLMWAMQLLQIINGMLATIAHAISVALMACKLPQNGQYDNNGAGSTLRGAHLPNPVSDDDLIARLRDEHLDWDRIHKIANAPTKIGERMKDRMRQQCKGFSGDAGVTLAGRDLMMVLPEGAIKAVHDSPLNNAPFYTGRPLPDTTTPDPDEVTVPGIGVTRESQGFGANTGTRDAQNSDPQFQDRVIGHFAYTPGGSDIEYGRQGLTQLPHMGVQLNQQQQILHQQQVAVAAAQVLGQPPPVLGVLDYQTSYCDVLAWTASHDSLFRYRFADLVRHNAMYESPSTDKHMIMDDMTPPAPRNITHLGEQFLMHRPHGARPDQPLPPWYSRQETSKTQKDTTRRDIAAAVSKRLELTGSRLFELCTPEQFWGARLTGLMAHYISRRASDKNNAFTAWANQIPHHLTRDDRQPHPWTHARVYTTYTGARNWLEEVSLKTSAFFDLCLYFDIPLFMQHLVVSPFVQYRVGATMLLRITKSGLAGLQGTGGGVGETHYSNLSCGNSQGSLEGHFATQFNVWFKPIILNAQYVVIDPCSMVDRYLQGNRGELMRTEDRMGGGSLPAYGQATRGGNVHQTGGHMIRTEYSIALPPGAPQFTMPHFDISGRFSSNACNEEQNVLHYPSAPFYAKFWGFRAVDNIGKQHVLTNAGNSVVSRVRSEFRNMETGQRVVAINQGHWGPDLEPGHLTNRKEGLIRPTVHTNVLFL